MPSFPARGNSNSPAEGHLAVGVYGHSGISRLEESIRPWPSWDEDMAREGIAQVAVQIDGRLRAVIEAPLDAEQDEVETQALAHPKVQPHLEGRAIARMIYVPGKIFNIVTR